MTTSSNQTKTKTKPSVVKKSKPAMTILNKVAALKLTLGQDSVERKKLSALTSIGGKSTIANALTKLKNEGCLLVTPDAVTITDKGMERVDSQAVSQAAESIPTTNQAYHEMALEQYSLKPKAKELFAVLSDGKTYPKTKAAAAIGCKMNSTFANLLTSLKKAGLIEFDRETVRLTDSMFPFEPRAE